MIAADLHVRSLNRRSWASGSSLPSRVNVIHMSTPCSPMVSWTNLSFLRRNSILRGELSSFTLMMSLIPDLSFLPDLRNQFLVAQHPFIRWRPFPLSMERSAQVEVRELNRELLLHYLK